jgi:hypothetical protein
MIVAKSVLTGMLSRGLKYRQDSGLGSIRIGAMAR